MKGFKDFILRGNLIELAVAFIVGAAFATLVKAFTEVIIELLAKAGGAQFRQVEAVRHVDGRPVPHRARGLPHHGLHRLLLHREAVRARQGEVRQERGGGRRAQRGHPCSSPRSATPSLRDRA